MNERRFRSALGARARTLLVTGSLSWTVACGGGEGLVMASPKPTLGPGSPAPASPAPGAPEPPRTQVDVAYPSSAGATILVPAGGDFQAALDSAMPGDAIVLEAGAVFKGPFTLPRKQGEAWIVVRSSADTSLPAPGGRVSPANASLMPKLEARSDSVITAESGSHHYRFVGIEVRPAKGTALLNLVVLGWDETSVEDQPHHMVFDRCYLHGDRAKGSRRGIALGSRDTAVIGSWLSDFKEVGADSQAIAGWNGAGPFRIENNYLEAAGENVLFGGADPSVRDLVPSDIEVVHNHFFKPVAWKVGDRAYEGKPWSVKNLFELKNARRVLVTGNLFEQNWVHSQNGFAILMTVRNQDGRAPWSSVEDVMFRDNVVRHTGSGVNILGHDDSAPSGPAQRLSIRNNLFEDVGADRWGGGGRLFQVLEGAANVVIEHNTGIQTGNLITAEGQPSRGFVYRDNIALHNAYGVVGTGSQTGLNTLAAFFPDAVFRRNVIVGGNADRYPPDNFFPGSVDAVGFVDRSAGDYRLAATSPYHGAATDGTDVGVNVDALAGALAAASERPAEAAAGTLPPPRAEASGATGLEAVLWASLLLLAYTNVGYPFFILAWARLRPRPFRTGPEEPSVTLLIAAHNEAAGIDARLQNLLSLDYPRSRLEIVVGSDGSDDGTVDHARAYEAAGVRVVELPVRRGKPSVLNALVPESRGEIVVLADARQRFDPGAIRALVAPFADPEVGAVTGELVLTEGEGSAVEKGVGLYWRCEKAIRRSEGRVGSVVGVTGAIYAIRRELFEGLPSDTILDDVLVPMRIVRRGYRVVFEPRARAYDHASATARGEFTRKVRTISGNFQLFARERWLLSFKNPLWLQTVSHKALRLLTPALLAVALGANLLLVGRPLFQLLLAAQVAFYAAALLGPALRRVRIPGLAVPYVVCMLAWATVVAFLSYVGGHQTVLWSKVATAR